MNDPVTNTEFGAQIVWADTENYKSMILIFKTPGAKLPLHFHKETEKSWFVNNGKFKIRWIDTKDGNLYEKEMTEGSVFHVEPLTPVELESETVEASISQVSNKDSNLDILQISPENATVSKE